MSDNFDYKPLPPFKWFVLENFPFIEADFDALTNWQLFCKIGKEINKIIDSQNLVGEQADALTDAFNQLQTYVNNYFDNLDVQDEINTKLDEMAIDGTLYNLINNELFQNINNQILQNSENIGTLNQNMRNTIKTDDTNVITNAMLSQEVREALTGGSTAVVSDNSITTNNIQNKAITIYKLDDLIQANFTKEYENVSLGNIISGNYKWIYNDEFTNGTNANMGYYSVALTKDTIYQYVGANWYSVNGIIIVDSTDDNSIVAYEPISDATKQFTSGSLIFQPNKTGLVAYINMWNGSVASATPREIVNMNTLTAINKISQNKQINQINLIKTLEGIAIDKTHSTSVVNFPRMASNQYATTKIYKLSTGTKYKVTGGDAYTYCGLILTDENGDVSYVSNDSNYNTQHDFEYEFTASNDGYALTMDFHYSQFDYDTNIYIVEDNKYKAMKWSLIGDSLTDPSANSSVKKYYDYIKDDLSINIQNLGQSGCGYKRKYNDGNNFVEQSLLVAQNTDVVTIFGSLNDYNEFSNMGTVNDTTTSTVLGCVYNTINNLITNRPNAKIGIILPTPWGTDNPTIVDTNTQTYLDGIKTIAKKYSIPVLDLFYESNMFPWNNTFKTLYYVSSDGVHPNSDGNKRFAYKIEEFIKTLI